MASNASGTSKRSTARPTATKAEQTPPDTSGDKETGNGNGNGEDTLTTDVLNERLKKDQSSFVNTKGEAIKDQLGFVKRFHEKGSAIAKTVRAKYDDWSKATGQLAELFLDARQAVALADGMPDWGGSSEAYKLLTERVVTDSFDPNQESRATVVNRLQKRTNRGLAARVGTYVNDSENLGLDAEQVVAICNKPEMLEGDLGKDEKVKKLVSGVNKQYRANRATKPAKNWPESPFKTSGDTERSNLSQAEKTAVQASKDMIALRNAVEFVKVDSLLDEAILVMQKLDEKMRGDNPQFGDEGKPGAVRRLYHIEAIVRHLAKTLEDRKIEKPEREAYEAARDYEPQAATAVEA